MTFLQFVSIVASSLGLGIYVTWIYLGEYYHRRIAERDAALLGHRCGLLDAELRRRQLADEQELRDLREALQATGPNWARAHREIAADEMARELELVAELRRELEGKLELVSFELTRLAARDDEHSRVRDTGSEPPT